MLTCPSCGGANPADASFCMRCATPLSAAAAAHEVRKSITALFCDLVGSTTLVERLDPEVLRPYLDRYFAAMREAVERHGGRVEKFIGDAVAAVFGLPVAHEDDALRAVRAGVEMQERMVSLNTGSPIPLAARIGITTGEMLVPGGGAPLIGDAMNTASRLQSSAEPGSVVIGEPTWRLVRDAVVAEPVEPLALKGKAEPVPAYRVVRVASLSPMRTRRLDAPMVGRKRESRLLEQAYERAATDRACQLFTVLGTAGAGKSRLVEEFLYAHADGDAEILRGRCLPYGEAITWYPITEALRGVLGLSDFADADVVRSAIHEAVGAEEYGPAIEANLARLFLVGEGGVPEEAFWAIRRFLKARARERPVVLVFDDIHWGEPMFFDLVEHVADWSRDASILLLCMARPELVDERPTWGRRKTNATTISLAPLTNAECGMLIAGLVGSSDLPQAVQDRITAVAEGNPLFVKEMLRTLADDGRLVEEGEGEERRWIAAGDFAGVHVPPTISALLSARLDRLTDPERIVVEAAAVEGRNFHRGAVAALVPEAERADLAVHLRSLVRRELITPERSSLPGEDAYRFGHQLIRDTAYDAIPKARRATFHAAFADWLEGVAGKRVMEQEAIVGFHLARAHAYRAELGLPEDGDLRLRAAAVLGSAGSRALDAGDARAAVQLLRPAAGIARGDRMEATTLLRLMRRSALDRPPSSSAVSPSALAGAAATADDVGYGIWDAKATSALMHEAVRAFREHGRHRVALEAISWVWCIELSLGRIGPMLEVASQALDSALELRDRRWITLCLGWTIAALEIGMTPLSEALARTTELVEKFPNEPATEAALRPDHAMIAAWLGNVEDARKHAATGRAIDRELGRRRPDWYDVLVDGYIGWAAQDLALAEKRFRLASLMLVERGDSAAGGLAGPPLARALLALGRDQDAAEAVNGFADAGYYPAARIAAPSVAAVIAARRGDIEAALRLSDEAMALAGQTDCLIDQADAVLDTAEVLLLAGRSAESHVAAEDALEKFERKEYAIGIRRARAFLTAPPG